MKDVRAYLAHILAAIEQIETYTVEGHDVFLSDRKTQDAVFRNFEIIGEAVKQLSPEILASAPEIPWPDIASMRDKLIHEYFGVDVELVWETVENDLPPLKSAIQRLLNDK